LILDSGRWDDEKTTAVSGLRKSIFGLVDSSVEIPIIREALSIFASLIEV